MPGARTQQPGATRKQPGDFDLTAIRALAFAGAAIDETYTQTTGAETPPAYRKHAALDVTERGFSPRWTSYEGR